MNDEQLLRYNRHIMLPQIDIDGQKKLLDAHVIIIGMGGLGSPLAMYLCSSGVGRLTLIDFDEVEISNLQRQIVHNEQQLGMNKTASAVNTLKLLNHQVNIDTITHKPELHELETLIRSCDADMRVVIDASDNFETRFMVNQACINTTTPLVSGAAIRFEGQLSVFDFRNNNSACYTCLYGSNTSDEELRCSESGVLAPVVGIIGCTMATEAIKLICGIGECLTGRLLILDALSMQWREMHFSQDPQCNACGQSQHG